METKPRSVSTLLVVAQAVLDTRNIYGHNKAIQAGMAENQSAWKYRANSGEDGRHVDFPAICVYALTFAFAVESEFNPGDSSRL